MYSYYSSLYPWQDAIDAVAMQMDVSVKLRHFMASLREDLRWKQYRMLLHYVRPFRSVRII